MELQGLFAAEPLCSNGNRILILAGYRFDSILVCQLFMFPHCVIC